MLRKRGGVSNFQKKRCEDARVNVISIMRGRVCVRFPGGKYYVTHEWPLLALGEWEGGI